MVTLCNCTEEGLESSYPFWPSNEEEQIKYGKIVVTLQSKTSHEQFVVRKFQLQEDKVWIGLRDGVG